MRACVLDPMAIVSPFEAREIVVPPTVTWLPGVKVVEPMTNPDAELAVIVEDPIVTTAGVVWAGVEGFPPPPAALDEAPVPGSTAAGDVDAPFPGPTTADVVD